MKNLILFLCIIVSTGAAQTTSDDEEARALAQQDIAALEKLQFSEVSKAHQQFFGSSSGKALADFVRGRTKKIEFSIFPPGVLARASDGVLTLDKRYPRLTQLKRWYLLIHESRHNETSRWSHAYCPMPFTFTLDKKTYNLQSRASSIAGTPGCDSSANGAYGVTYAFLKSIAETCTNCSEELKLEAIKISKTEGFIRITNPDQAKQMIERSTVYLERALKEAHETCVELANFLP